MKVNLYATLRPIVGQKTVELDVLPGATAMALVHKLVEMYPALGPELLDADKRFHRHMKLFINGREAEWLENKLDTAIHPDDKIDIFPPVGGG